MSSPIQDAQLTKPSHVEKWSNTKRTVSVVTASLECLLFCGIIFGWPGISYVYTRVFILFNFFTSSDLFFLLGGGTVHELSLTKFIEEHSCFEINWKLLVERLCVVCSVEYLTDLLFLATIHVFFIDL